MSVMWTMVSGCPETMWVKTIECRLANGELAFVDELGPAPQSPPWLVGPEGSLLQQRQDGRAGGDYLREFRSLRAPAEDVLAYYRELVERSGLAILPDRRPGRLCSGFRAKSAEFGFHIYVFERKGLSFWNTGLYTESYKKRKWLPPYLHFLEQDHERVKMRSAEHRPKECWAPVSAISKTEPSVEKKCSFVTESILWSSLPKWIQFNIEDGREGKVYLWEEEDGSKGWNAQISAQIEGDPRSAFESWLDDLEALGFAMRGTEGLDRGYYISVMWNWPSAHIQSGSGDEGSIGMNDAYRRWETENQWDMHIVYTPVPGTPQPKLTS